MKKCVPALLISTTGLASAQLTGSGVVPYLPDAISEQKKLDIATALGLGWSAYPEWTFAGNAFTDKEAAPGAIAEDWSGTFTSSAAIPSTPTKTAWSTTLNFSELSKGYLPAGTVLQIWDVDGGPGEFQYFEAKDPEGNPIETPWLSLPVAYWASANEENLPTYSFNASGSGAYYFDGSGINSGENTSAYFTITEDIGEIFLNKSNQNNFQFWAPVVEEEEEEVVAQGPEEEQEAEVEVDPTKLSGSGLVPFDPSLLSAIKDQNKATSLGLGWNAYPAWSFLGNSFQDKGTIPGGISEDWVGTFTSSTSIPFPSNNTAWSTTLNFSELSKGYLPAGTVLQIWDINNGSGEYQYFEAKDPEGNTITKPWLSKPIAYWANATEENLPSYTFNAADSGEYYFDGSAGFTNESTSAYFTITEDIGEIFINKSNQNDLQFWALSAEGAPDLSEIEEETPAAVGDWVLATSPTAAEWGAYSLIQRVASSTQSDIVNLGEGWHWRMEDSTFLYLEEPYIWNHTTQSWSFSLSDEEGIYFYDFVAQAWEGRTRSGAVR